MEDYNQGSKRSRYSRPQSSHSRDKMTPTSSSNCSSANLPRNSHANSRSSLSQGASLLQERLRERKVESARQIRQGSVDMGHLRDREVQSSPIVAVREERRPSSGKGMGVKQIEEQVSTLHKQNFDLKLELYHRRQRQETLEARLLAAEKQLEDQAELQEINEQLLAELEKRDQAVEEAVGIIVTLEDKVDHLMKEREGVRAFEAEYDTSYSSNDMHGSPPQFESRQSRLSVPRMPSFLSERSEGTGALRSLYLPIDRNYTSEASLPKLSEETHDGMETLSVLSESSFISIYGKKPAAKVELAEDNEIPRRHRASSSVEQWIDARPASTAPAPRPQIPKNRFLSINTILDSPLQRLEKLKLTLERHTATSLTSQVEMEKGKSKIKEQISFDHGLPPTPDTFSTDALRHAQNHEGVALEYCRKNSSFLDSSSTFSTQPRQSTASIRPRSAGETITSRSEGHGWDTETRNEFAEGSVSSSSSTYNGPSYRRQNRVKTPTLFSFGGERWDQERQIDPSMQQLTMSAANHYRKIRRSSLAEQSDVPETHQPQPQPQPQPPPARRSSLVAPTKFRNVHNSESASPAKDSKISRLSGRIFGRPDGPPSPAFKSRSSSLFTDNDEARATPPPIKRNRGPPQVYRPSSAGVGSRSRTEEEADTASVAEVDNNGLKGPKKWFGLARAGSLRRT